MYILSIRFRLFGQTSLFTAPEAVAVGEQIMVETEQGLELGTVMHCYDSLPVEQEEALTPILRLATAEEKESGRANEELAQQARHFCRQCINNRHLDMKLVDVEIFFDRSKFVFYFTAPARIDFRELVKDLVREYRSRIELRQIGVRHETQMVGAVGNCGMVCCCRRYLRKFAPVTIRMAKEQNLFLNPTKISGICGRLLCCLSYEQENYDTFHHACPRLGKKYQTTQGGMKVLRANMFRNSVSVLSESNEELEFTLEEWQDLNPFRPEGAPQAQQTGQAAQRPKPAPDEGLLVFSATPDTVDDPALFDDMLPLLDENPAPATPEVSFEPVEGTKKKKRRKKPRGES